MKKLWQTILGWFGGSSSSKSPPAFGKGTISGYGPAVPADFENADERNRAHAVRRIGTR